jgi:hypothetical protein
LIESRSSSEAGRYGIWKEKKTTARRPANLRRVAADPVA